MYTRAQSLTIMVTHEQRIQILRDLLDICHKNGWTYDTKAIADRMTPYVKGMGFGPTTVKSLVASVVDLLLLEKKTGKPWAYGA